MTENTACEAKGGGLETMHGGDEKISHITNACSSQQTLQIPL